MIKTTSERERKNAFTKTIYFKASYLLFKTKCGKWIVCGDNDTSFHLNFIHVIFWEGKTMTVSVPLF